MRMKPALSILVPAVLILHAGTARATICGDAYFNHDINWPNTGNLYYTVVGAPANTCGDLYADRNGGGYQLNAAGWICTDGSGNATKGPWYYGSQGGNETASAYIDWGTCESPERGHIWDVENPDPDIDSSVPSDFYGTADDQPWGAGFDDDWTQCQAVYYNSTTGLYWTDGTGSYSSSSWTSVPCSLSGMGGVGDRYVDWYTTSAQRPELSDHQSGHSYVWYVWIWDGGHYGGDLVAFGY